MARETRKQTLARAVKTGDWTRWEAIKDWSLGGYRPRHSALRKARRLAEKQKHWLAPFQSGTQIVGTETGDPDLYSAECRHCGRTAFVSFDFDRDPIIRGYAITTACGTELK